MSRLPIAALALIVFTADVSAQPIIDGSASDTHYGGAVATQDTQTGFGDSMLGRPDWADGSELDNAYAVVLDDTL